MGIRAFATQRRRGLSKTFCSANRSSGTRNHLPGGGGFEQMQAETCEPVDCDGSGCLAIRPDRLFERKRAHLRRHSPVALPPGHPDPSAPPLEHTIETSTSSSVQATVFSPVTTRRPARPDAPGGPATPCGPDGPCGPGAPGGPCGPVDPTGPGVPFSPGGPACPCCPWGPCGPEQHASSRLSNVATKHAVFICAPCYTAVAGITTHVLV